MRFRFFTANEPPFDKVMERTCKNCNNSFHGRYCNTCGEKVVEQYERSIRYFIDSAFNAFTFIEGKFWLTLKTVLKHPGMYSKHFIEGVRQRYMKPIAFFFVGNVIFFLFPIFGNTFSTQLVHQQSQHLYGPLVQTRIDRELKERNITFEEFEKGYNAQSFNITKTIIVLIIPIFSLFLFLVNYNRGGYFSDHLLLSAELMSFLLFVDMILLPMILLPIYLLLRNTFGLQIEMGDAFVSPIIAITLLYFLVKAERAMYNLTWAKAFGKSFILFACLLATVHFYRFILFYATLWTL